MLKYHYLSWLWFGAWPASKCELQLSALLSFSRTPIVDKVVRQLAMKTKDAMQTIVYIRVSASWFTLPEVHGT